VAGLLLIFTAQVAIAAIFGRTTNGTNTVSALTLVSPTAASGVYTPSKVVLTWTAASPMNGQGYFIRAMNNGASAACPAGIGSYVTIVGSTAGVTLTDIGAIAQGAPGTFACYLIQTGYSSAGGPPWAAAPQWTSTTALAIASVRLGVVNVQIGPEAAVQTTNVTYSLPLASTAGTLLVAMVSAGPSVTKSTATAGWQYANGVNEPGEGRNEIWYYPNNPGGILSATFTMAAGNQAVGQMTEWKNVSTVLPFDTSGVVAIGPGAQVNAVVSTAAAATVANELAITNDGFNFVAGAPVMTITQGAGWLNLKNDPPGGFSSEYRVDRPAAVITETITTNRATQWSVVMATFK
jgi:hypothetical protein